MHEHHDHHAHSSKWKLGAAIILNTVITAAEFIGGIASGSLALLSDAGHNLSDVLSLILGFAGEKVSERSPTNRYSFGMKRFEVLIALVNAVTLLGIGAYILYESAMRLLSPRPIDISVMLPVACVGLGGNLLSIIILFRDRDRNLNMKASFLHLFYDTISSVAVVAAAVALFFTGYHWIDMAVSAAIVVMIYISSWSIIRQSLTIFLQGAPNFIDPEAVGRTLLSIEPVVDVHGLHIWSVSSTEVFLSAHICLTRDDSARDTDSIIRTINEVLDREFGIRHTTIQIEQTPLCSLKSGECCR